MLFRSRTVVKAGFTGTVSLTVATRLEELLDADAHAFAALWRRERTTDLVVRPEDDDFADLDLAGFARETLEELRARAEEGEPAARDALALLVRLAGSET